MTTITMLAVIETIIGWEVGEHSDSDIIGKGKGGSGSVITSFSIKSIVNNKIQLYTLLQAIMDSSWLNSIAREKESL